MNASERILQICVAEPLLCSEIAMKLEIKLEYARNRVSLAVQAGLAVGYKVGPHTKEKRYQTTQAGRSALERMESERVLPPKRDLRVRPERRRPTTSREAEFDIAHAKHCKEQLLWGVVCDCERCERAADARTRRRA